MGDGPLGLAERLSSFSDADRASAYAVPTLQWAVGQGLLKGSDGQLDPQGSATRAQVAAVLHRALAQ